MSFTPIDRPPTPFVGAQYPQDERIGNDIAFPAVPPNRIDDLSDDEDLFPVDRMQVEADCFAQIQIKNVKKLPVGICFIGRNSDADIVHLDPKTYFYYMRGKSDEDVCFATETSQSEMYRLTQLHRKTVALEVFLNTIDVKITPARSFTPPPLNGGSFS